jgi:hypothetical protein
MSEENAVASEVVEISATYKKGEEGDRECTILFDFGGDMDKAAEKFGKEVVYSNFVRAAKVTAQSAMRRLMEQGKADDEVQSTMEAWKPGVALERTVDPTAALLRTFPSLSPEAQAKLIADLTAKAAKAA